MQPEERMAEQAQIEELKQKMAEERGRLLAVLERLDDADATKPTTGEGEWRAKQQMAHLCEMETAYRAWVAKALQEDGASVDGVRGEPPAIPLEQANAHSVGEHVGEMRRQREKTVALIDSLRPEDFERTGIAEDVRLAHGDAVAAVVLPARPDALRPGARRGAGVQAALRRRQRAGPATRGRRA